MSTFFENDDGHDLQVWIGQECSKCTANKKLERISDQWFRSDHPDNWKSKENALMYQLKNRQGEEVDYAYFLNFDIDDLLVGQVEHRDWVIDCLDKV